MNNLIVAAVIAAVAAGAGWTARDWKADADSATVAAKHAKSLATANADTLDAQKKLGALRDEKAAGFAAIDKEQTEQLRIAENETKRLRLCIANGTCGLRVNVVRTEPASILPGTADPGRVDAATGAGLTPGAEQDYFALREGIDRLQRKLSGLQQSFGVLNPDSRQ